MPVGTKVNPKFLPNERINIFLSFRLTDVESRYVNSEREYLAIVRCLVEVRWLVIRSKFLIIVYSNYEALKLVMNTGYIDKGRIVN